MKSFRYDFTMSELYYFLFKKKNCPKCGNIMYKSKGFETVDGSIFDNVSAPLYIKGREIKYYHYLFSCPKCETQYKLTDLVKK